MGGFDHQIHVSPVPGTISGNHILLRGHRKSLQTPSEKNKVSFTSKPLPRPETNKTSHFRLQLSDQRVYKTPFVRFFRKTPPSQMNSVRFTGLLRTFAMAPYLNRHVSSAWQPLLATEHITHEGPHFFTLDLLRITFCLRSTRCQYTTKTTTQAMTDND